MHIGFMVTTLASRLSGRVWALAGDTVLCSSARHFTLTVRLSTQVYRWVPANLMLGLTLWWTQHPIAIGSRNTPSRFMLLKLEISADLMSHLALVQNLPFFTFASPTLHTLCTFPQYLVEFNDSPTGNCSIAWVIASGIPISWIPKADELKHKCHEIAKLLSKYYLWCYSNSF